METSEKISLPVSHESELIGQVASMLQATGIPASPAEVREYAAAYAFLTQGLKALYGIPGCTDELPALQFAAAPRMTDWVRKDLSPTPGARARSDHDTAM